MNKSRKILIFCEKSKKIGNGHYIRSWRLYQFLISKNFKAVLYLNKNSNQINQVIKKEKSILYIVIDYKNFKKIFIIKNNKIIKILSVENLKKKIFFKDKKIYPLDIQFGKYSGPKYYFYPKNFPKIKKNHIFKKWERRKKIKILIIQGGTDANNNLNKIINILLNKKLNFKYQLLVKVNKKKSLRKKYLTNKQIKIIGHLKSMDKFYKRIHLAISACGGVAFELGYLGIPAIHVTTEPRELRRAAIFEKKKLGIFCLPKNSKDIIYELNKIYFNKKYRATLIKNKMNYFRKRNYFIKLFS